MRKIERAQSLKGRGPLRIPFIRTFILSVLLAFAFTGGAWARDICVKLSEQPSIAVKSSGALTVTDASKKQFKLGSSATLARSGGYAVSGRQRFQLPLQISANGLLGFNNRQYKGEFLLTREFVLINVVDVEDYVRGVLPAEGISGWPKEYQRAQAIISRTYGLRQSLNRSARGYDVADDTSDQVYKGAGVETSVTNQAVADTAAEVLTYGDTLAFTPFHSDSGGHTATNAHVWGSDIPYLTGVKEPVAYQSPNSNWTAKIPASRVETALSKMGSGVGKVREIRVTGLDAGGRATTLMFVGSAGTASAKSSTFRTYVGSNLLKSTLLVGGVPMVPETPNTPAAPQASPAPARPARAAASTAPQPPVPTSNTPMTSREETRLTGMTTDGIFTSAELLDMLMNPDKRKGYLYIGIQRLSGAPEEPKDEPPQANLPQASLPQAIPDASMPALRSAEVILLEDGHFTFRGKGWGHGVGLSQWGAMAMAKDGWTAERILEYYYPGTAVKRYQ